jgi:hypothetical protein
MALHFAESSKMLFACIVVISGTDIECKKRLQQMEDYLSQ